MWPPRETAAALHVWATAAQRASGGRVTRLETIHLTLAFLGDVDEGLVPSLKDFKVKGEKHALPIEQARYWRHNRIIWVGPKDLSASFVVLSGNLRKKLKENEFRIEARPFAAHITLIRKARDPGPLPPLPAVEWPVEEFVLVRSQLSSEGSRYDVLQRYPLR